MTPEQQLIQQIRQLLNANQFENKMQLEDLAEQFADICRNANERLLRCADYLGKGRRSEAVYEAHLSPDLLVLADDLSGDWLKKWQNVVLDLELTNFQPLNQELISQLREEGMAEQSLEPLIKEYRRCVYQSDHRKCIDILRQIRAKDPLNPNWEKNLRPLEEKILPEWLERLQRGLESMDLTDLRLVYRELTHPQRVVQPPELQMRQLRKALLSERAQDLEAEAENLLSQIREAMERHDEEALSHLWKKGEVLEADEAFLKRPADWQEVLADSHRLSETLIAERNDRESFEQAVSRLKDRLMEDNVNPVDLRHDYERLTAWGKPIPPMLIRQVNEVLAERRRRRRQKTVMLAFISVFSIVVLVAISCWWLHVSRQQSARADWLSRASQYEGSSRWEELQALLEEIRLGDAVFYSSSELAGIRENLTQAMIRRERSHRDFLAYKATLEEIRNGGFKGSHASILRTLDSAKSVVQTAEEKAYVMTWQRQWVKLTALREKEADLELSPVLTELRTTLLGLAKAEGEGLRDELTRLTEISKQLHDIDQQALEACGKDIRDLYGELEGRLQVRLSDVKQRMKAWHVDTQRKEEKQRLAASRLAALRREIPQALPDFNRYETLLKRFVETGSDSPEFSDYRTILQKFPSYRSVLALTDRISAAGLYSSAMDQTVTALLSPASPVSTSIWRTDLERVKNRCQINKILQQRISTMINLRKGNLYVMKLRPHGTQAWIPLYSDRPFQSQNKEGTWMYWGNAYWAADSESQVTLVPTAQVNGGHVISSNSYEVLLSHNKHDSLAAHVRLMKKLVAESMRSDDVPVFLLGELEKLRKDAEVNPVQGLLIFKRFINLLAIYCPEELPECKKLAEQANAIDTDIPWQRYNHPLTIQATRQIKEFWKDVPDLQQLQQRLIMNRDLLAAVLRTDLRCVGSVQLDKDGRKAFFPVARGKELWLYRPAGAGLLASFSLLQTDVSGLPMADHLASVPVGAPVFAPMPGREVLPQLKLIQKTAGPAFNQLVLPRALPSTLGY